MFQCSLYYSHRHAADDTSHWSKRRSTVPLDHGAAIACIPTFKLQPRPKCCSRSFSCCRHGVRACFTLLPTFFPVRPVPLPTPLPKPPIPLPNSFPPFNGLAWAMFLPKRLPPRPASLPPCLYT